jgi:glycosyltransferase involved in cell wall biosynthesis
MSPRVHQVLATLGYGDAIGHEVLGIQRVLRGAGFESEIFVETADPRLEDLTVDYREMVGAVQPSDLLIHHFSIGSRASRTAYALPGRMALVYHNITPPEYFIGVHKDLVKLCFRGRRELTAYIPRCELALGDSEYNRQELEALGFPATGVLPVVPDFTHLDVVPDRMLASQVDDAWTNVMFVGRVIPNKKFENVIRAFHVYRTRHNPRARLLLVGSYSGFERYLAMLQALVARLGTPDVHFLGHVSNEQLTALYDVADVFLCASEHEGFCVPLIEAFYKRVPVLAYAATAVPATMDGGGVLYETTDPADIARLLEAVTGDARLEEAVLASQDAALDRLRGKDFGATLLRFIEGVLARPPREAPEVAFDFWQQFDRFERLEELRQFRPALYRALPGAPTPAPLAQRPGSGVRDPGSAADDSGQPGASRGDIGDPTTQATHRTPLVIGQRDGEHSVEHRPGPPDHPHRIAEPGSRIPDTDTRKR